MFGLFKKTQPEVLPEKLIISPLSIDKLLKHHEDVQSSCLCQTVDTIDRLKKKAQSDWPVMLAACADGMTVFVLALNEQDPDDNPGYMLGEPGRTEIMREYAEELTVFEGQSLQDVLAALEKGVEYLKSNGVTEDAGRRISAGFAAYPPECMEKALKLKEKMATMSPMEQMTAMQKLLQEAPEADFGAWMEEIRKIEPKQQA